MLQINTNILTSFTGTAIGWLQNIWPISDKKLRKHLTKHNMTNHIKLIHCHKLSLVSSA